MSDTNPYPALDLEEDSILQRREWRWQRAGWVVLFVIVGLALAGVFGDGPLSSAHVVSRTQGNASSAVVTADYERFTRVGSATRIAIRLEGAPLETGDVSLEVERRFYDHARIERITPEPDRVALGAKTVKLVYASGRLRAGSGIVLDYEPTAAGLRTLRFGFAGSSVEMRQLAYF